MGGNAIKRKGKSICGRLPRDAYRLVKALCIQRLKPWTTTVEHVLELPGKKTFGDLDLLVVLDTSSTGLAVEQLPFKVFASVEKGHIVQNGYVTSFALPWIPFLRQAASESDERQKNELKSQFGGDDLLSRLDAIVTEGQALAESLQFFQIDLLKMTSLSHLEHARFYFSYSDLGSILGRMYNRVALKFGDEGLWAEVYENTVDPTQPFDNRINSGKCVLSSDPKEVCAFSGLDYQQWLDFRNLPEDTTDFSCIFEWAKKCKFFRKDIFITLNSDHRRRANKRPFYLQFMNSIGVQREDVVQASQETGGILTNGQPEALAYFKKEWFVNDIRAARKLDAERREKFSGAKLIEKCNAKLEADFLNGKEDRAISKREREALEITGIQIIRIVSDFQRFCLGLPSNATLYEAQGGNVVPKPGVKREKAVKPIPLLDFFEKVDESQWHDFVDKNDKAKMDELMMSFIQKYFAPPAQASATSEGTQ